MVAKRFDHFGVGKFEQAGALFNQGDAHAQGGKHAGIFDADDAATHDEHGSGNFRHAKNLIAIDDGAAIEGYQGRLGGFCAGGDNDVAGFVFGLVARAFHLNVMRIEKAGGAGADFDAVAGELCADDVHFRLDDADGAEGEIGHGDAFLHAIVTAVNALILIAGEMQDGFANGLAGDCASVDGGAADDFELLDEGGAFAEFGGLNGSALASRPGTNDDEIVLFHENRREYSISAEKAVMAGGNPGAHSRLVEDLIANDLRSALPNQLHLREKTKTLAAE